MIALALLAFGHWSACAPVYIPKYGSHEYYAEPVCSYYWIDKDRMPLSIALIVARAPRPQTETPDISYIGVGYDEPNYLVTPTSADVRIQNQDGTWGPWLHPGVTGAENPTTTPLSHCYLTGEAHDDLELPCVEIEPQ